MSETDTPKPDAPEEKAPNQPTLTELSPEQLEQVSGGAGSLTKACATGKHIPTATITV